MAQKWDFSEHENFCENFPPWFKFTFSIGNKTSEFYKYLKIQSAPGFHFY